MIRRLASPKLNSALQKAAILATVGLPAVLGVVGARAYISITKAREITNATAATQKEIGTTRQLLEQARRIRSVLAGQAGNSVADFQGAIQARSNARGCDLTEFQASSTATPYVDRFKKTTEKSDWQQLDAKFVLRGRQASVIASLEDLSSQPVPFEFTSLELARVLTDTSGEATVEARVELRILIRGADVPAGGG